MPRKQLIIDARGTNKNNKKKIETYMEFLNPFFYLYLVAGYRNLNLSQKGIG